MTRFLVEAHQHEYVAAGAIEVDAVVTVTASGADFGARAVDAAEIFIIGVSGPSSDPTSIVPTARQAATREAVAAAVDAIRDGARFAVIAGGRHAQRVYPVAGSLEPASPLTRQEAKRAISEWIFKPGIAIGSWLTMTDQLFKTSGTSINHAILLTDGTNEGESPEELERILETCRGHFQCDCRGLGTEWTVTELGRWRRLCAEPSTS